MQACTTTCLCICKIAGLHNRVHARLHDHMLVCLHNSRLARLHPIVCLHTCLCPCLQNYTCPLAQLHAWLFANLLACTSVCLHACMLGCLHDCACTTTCLQNWALAPSLACLQTARLQTARLHNCALAGLRACRIARLHAPGRNVASPCWRASCSDLLGGGGCFQQLGGVWGPPKTGFGAPPKELKEPSEEARPSRWPHWFSHPRYILCSSPFVTLRRPQRRNELCRGSGGCSPQRGPRPAGTGWQPW